MIRNSRIDRENKKKKSFQETEEEERREKSRNLNQDHIIQNARI